MLRQSPIVQDALHFHTAGFIAGVEGEWTDATLLRFQKFLKQRDLAISDGDLLLALEQARCEFLDGSHRLSVCTAHPCCHGHAARLPDSEFAKTGLQVIKTGCLGICKQAPAMSLRVGNRNQSFALVTTGEEWEAILAFASAAAESNSLLVDAGKAQSHFYDPVHDHGGGTAVLAPLQFLLGRFRGEGRQATDDYTFEKEVVGTYEAGGQFIGLRMDASYPMGNGRLDVHRAFVIVGRESSSGHFTGCAYTDGGVIHPYDVELNQTQLTFADTPPDHSNRWKRARKTLTPTHDGYEERLEVDAGSGFETYYTIPMRKIDEGE